MQPHAVVAPNDSQSLAASSLLGVERGHAVQFYERDDFLVATVADFLADGLALGQPVLAIATAAHREAVERRLAARGVDVAHARETGRLTLLDAQRTLARFMAGAMPDEQRFRSELGGVLDRSRNGGGSVVRAFGEMVDLLWKDGNHDGALRVEALWNELAQTHGFALLCGYAIGGFADAADVERFRQVCEHHHHVLPTERYTQASEIGRLLEISSLQQRATALETEVVRRELLEQQLRHALADRERLLGDERAARAEAERAWAAAQEASRAKSAFLAVMSHELRTPLNAICGYVDLLTTGVYGSLTDPQRDALGRVRRSNLHLLGLIDQVLGYAHVESGAVRFEVADVPLEEILRTAEALLLPQMRAKGIAYAPAPTDLSVVVRADGDRVRQIVLNLLTNATKYTPDGGQVRVEYSAAGAWVTVRVHDTGIGIAAEKLAVVFEPFVQADSDFTRVQGGVGLGLAISRDLARAMGGELTVASTPGAGSTFTLTLPRAGTEPVLP